MERGALTWGWRTVQLRDPKSGRTLLLTGVGRQRSQCYREGKEVRRCFPSNEAANRRFKILLSRGWQVVAINGQQLAPVAVAGEEQKKFTSEVTGGQSGDQGHGGNHASCEVEDSPNAAENGKRARGCRGGRSKKAKAERKQAQQQPKPLRRQTGGGSPMGGSGVYAPQPLRVTPELLASAEESAKMLSKLLGKSPRKLWQGVEVRAKDLLVALEVGDNPIPPLEAPRERRRLRVLVSPDCSGSTQGWSGLACAWARHLEKLPEVDVIYVKNFNGKFWDVDTSDRGTEELLARCDLLLYLGDSDGEVLCHHYAKIGATVIAFDSYCANAETPRLRTSKKGTGVVHWVDRVSAHAPQTWTQALSLVLG